MIRLYILEQVIHRTSILVLVYSKIDILYLNIDKRKLITVKLSSQCSSDAKFTVWLLLEYSLKLFTSEFSMGNCCNSLSLQCLHVAEFAKGFTGQSRLSPIWWGTFLFHLNILIYSYVQYVHDVHVRVELEPTGCAYRRLPYVVLVIGWFHNLNVWSPHHTVTTPTVVPRVFFYDSLFISITHWIKCIYYDAI